MWFPVDWLHTSVCLARALSFAHHPLPQSESLSDPYYKQEYLQIHKFRKSWNNPDMKWTYTLLRDNRWELVGMQLYSEIYEKYTPLHGNWWECIPRYLENIHPCMEIWLCMGCTPVRLGGNVSRGILRVSGILGPPPILTFHQASLCGPTQLGLGFKIETRVIKMRSCLWVQATPVQEYKNLSIDWTSKSSVWLKM